MAGAWRARRSSCGLWRAGLEWTRGRPGPRGRPPTSPVGTSSSPSSRGATEIATRSGLGRFGGCAPSVLQWPGRPPSLTSRGTRRPQRQWCARGREGDCGRPRWALLSGCGADVASVSSRPRRGRPEPLRPGPSPDVADLNLQALGVPELLPGCPRARTPRVQRLRALPACVSGSRITPIA